MSRRRRASVLLLVAVIATAGCSSTVVREQPGARHAPARRVSTPRPGAIAVVARGETLYSIATRNGVSVLDLASWNSLPPPYTIYPGQRLRLYPGGSAPTRAASRGAATPATSPRSQPPAVAPAPPTASFAWRWPAEGTLVGRFLTGEPTQQGIDIAGAEGATVRSAADGTVVYSGAGLVGYGELVIVKHGDQWLSAYGHNRKRLVNEGQLVKAGDPIAEMGHSGAPRDMLHFEIRYAGKPVDPLIYLPPR
ncbi:peptidoglycan DD-metalloendopeptidase family protein [Cognatilysobacter lacus]|uniref:Peptidoglycan DD-metalloendopeptidase family protein n=1 Tax=Cognatilysobacter lacus TaxID=1643323 RepID=A0A5D8ZB21_9GAMM|nr:peptidoglycan DD-metalloendopeptidase family protein [Lysobacter lacus]TZF91322.1 peptidoglycan DD-metalloendopeptidase family protein [Lysobacter lacus]